MSDREPEALEKPPVSIGKRLLVAGRGVPLEQFAVELARAQPIAGLPREPSNDVGQL